MTDRSHLDENGIDPRHAIIIDSLPHYKSKKEVLIVGSGNCKKDRALLEMGYEVTSTDYLPEAEKYDFEKPGIILKNMMCLWLVWLTPLI